MLQFLSFFVTLALFAGLMSFIVTMIRNASGSIIAALNGEMSASLRRENFVNFDRRTVRPTVALRSAFAPLRAAA